ncbi:uncharacterized protein MYCFIDRAFT_45436 [Pseudocercospora fijiensis CIRAD86]|uniref:Elongator complex protein 5 n=1 Tax=Pseudocercospora fijiensis (strain CIRAD86) TaxID=383855 RepID=M3AP86_PSEFD|nr:uncharacterized protein MYCFIDRAFT_45436 [Pseudocercospora fijiensis CIRAD86]EME86416.1 hypothetical protein MYCFIDRAFT_45436 [Pseudocercospora fijiensis CIRAD86]
MAPSSLQHRRTHNLLLVSKLLNQRDGSSPFTLVLDSLEQSGKPLLAEFVKRAYTSNTQVILVSFETLRKPGNVAVFIEAWKQSLPAWQKEIAVHLKTEPTQSKSSELGKSSAIIDRRPEKLLVFDSLNALSATESSNLPGLLSSFISPTTSLLALHHTDIPSPVAKDIRDAYSPDALTLLRYLATTIFTVHSLHNVLARKAARDRSHAEPSFGLDEGIEGILQGRGANNAEGLVLEMEHRRKSGRGVREWYFLPLNSRTSSTFQPGKSREVVSLLEDHPQYRSPEDVTNGAEAAAGKSGTTFELGLTDKQRRDREGVVLPYYDAQKGGGEGGRILYDMGEEDDFDEEEDEI